MSLTYDDGLPVHFQHVAPQLAAAGITGTFNLPIGHLRAADTQQWRDVAAMGHELGNHSIFHPCRQPPEGFPWLAPDYDLCHYTPTRWRDEMRVANYVLEVIDGQRERTFHNTCCANAIGQGDSLSSMEPLILEQFVAGRGECISRIVDPANANFGALGHFNGDTCTFDKLRTQIDDAVAQGGWIIYMFHGVGEGTHNGFIHTDEHAKLVEHLASRSSEVWSASLVEVAKHVRSANQA